MLWLRFGNEAVVTAKTISVHLLVRYSDALMGVEDTIGEHTAVISRRGAVWFGKVGKGLSATRLQQLNAQCGSGAATSLFLVQNRGRPGHADYVFHEGKVIQVAEQLPARAASLVPTYYRRCSLVGAMRLWVKVDSIRSVPASRLAHFHIASSQRTVRSALEKSLAAVFVLGEGAGISFFE
jgi:hypothetical protein